MIKRKPTHPGELLLEDVIKPLGITITDAARKLGVSRKTLSEFVNQKAWQEKAIVNIANMGTFSSDRSIKDYARDVWDVKPCHVG